jgi:hypothetical protein
MIRRKGKFGGKRRDAESVEMESLPTLKNTKRAPGKDELHIKDASYEETYATVPSNQGVEGSHIGLRPRSLPIRLFKKSPDKTTCQVLVWNTYSHEWMSMTVPGDMLVSTEISLIPITERPRKVQDIAKKKADRAAHLPKFQRVKPIPEKIPADGKKVFKGKLGRVSVLLDIGDGSKVCEVPDGTTFADAAKKLKRVLVSQSSATEYAMFVFTEAWKAGRKAMRDMVAK